MSTEYTTASTSPTFTSNGEVEPLAKVDKIVPYIVAVLSSFLFILFLLMTYATYQAGSDWKALKYGHGFLKFVCFGALAGQSFLVMHSLQYLVGFEFLLCHVQFLLLLLHGHLMLAPVLAKLFRLFWKIRRAESRPERLVLWDTTAKRITNLLLALAVTLMAVQLIVIGETGRSGQRDGCVDRQASLDTVEQFFFYAHGFLLLTMIVAAWAVTAAVSRSRFRPLFNEWGKLCQALQALTFAMLLCLTSFYSTRLELRLLQQFLSVQLLNFFVGVQFGWKVFHRRILPQWLKNLAQRCCGTARSQDKEIARAIGLHQFLLERAKEKAERYAHRLKDLQMQQKLNLETVRLGPHHCYLRHVPLQRRQSGEALQRRQSGEAAAASAPAPPPPTPLVDPRPTAAAIEARPVGAEWIEGWVTLRRDGKIDISIVLESSSFCSNASGRIMGGLRSARRRPSNNPDCAVLGASTTSTPGGLGSTKQLAAKRRLAFRLDPNVDEPPSRTELAEGDGGGPVLQLVATRQEVGGAQRLSSRVNSPYRLQSPYRRGSCGHLLAAVRSGSPQLTWQLRFDEELLLGRWLRQLAGSTPNASRRGVVAPEGSSGSLATLLPPRQLRVWAGSWNAGDISPPYDKLPQEALRQWLRPEGTGDACDIYAIGFQELNELKEGQPGRGESMADLLLDVLGPSEFSPVLGELHNGHGMNQMRIYVFVRTETVRADLDRFAVASEGCYRPTYKTRQALPSDVSGRKGGVSMSLQLGRTRLCFVSCHLEAHQGDNGELLERNRHAAAVLYRGIPPGDSDHEGGEGADERPDDPCAAYDHIFVVGDLNYRLGPPFGRATVSSSSGGAAASPGGHGEPCASLAVLPPTPRVCVSGSATNDEGDISQQEALEAHLRALSAREAPLPCRADKSEYGRQYWADVVAEVQAQDWAALHRRDQLRRQAAAGHAFDGFELGGDLAFIPTFKQVPQGHKLAGEPEVPSAARRYHKQRMPSYCDRVLVRSLPGALCEREAQGAVEREDNPSDHTPVWAIFTTQYRPPWPEPTQHDVDHADELQRGWFVELRGAKVDVLLEQLLERGGPWAHFWETKWPKVVRTKQHADAKQPKLSLVIEAPFLAHGRERLTRKRGTLSAPWAEPTPTCLRCAWEGGRFAVSPRWLAALRTFMQMRSARDSGFKPSSWRDPADEFMRAEGATVKLHLSAICGGNIVPLGSACLSAADVLAPPHGEAAANQRTVSPNNERGQGPAPRFPRLTEFRGESLGDFRGARSRNSVPTGLDSLTGRADPLTWCGVRCGTLDVGLSLHVPKGAPQLPTAHAPRSAYAPRFGRQMSGLKLQRRAASALDVRITVDGSSAPGRPEPSPGAPAKAPPCKTSLSMVEDSRSLAATDGVTGDRSEKKKATLETSIAEVDSQRDADSTSDRPNTAPVSRREEGDGGHGAGSAVPMMIKPRRCVTAPPDVPQ